MRREPSTRYGAKFVDIGIADIDMDIADIHITTQKMYISNFFRCDSILFKILRLMFFLFACATFSEQS